MPAQTQPVAAMIALPILLLCPIAINRITRPFIIFAVLVLVYMIATLFLYPAAAIGTIANAGGYFSIIILFLVFWDKLDLLSPKPLFIALAIWVMVGAIQAFPFPGAIKSAMASVGHFMLERFVAEAYSDGGRGYSLIASEPSISAPTLLYMGLTLYFFRTQRKLSRMKMMLGFAMVAFLMVLNRSGTLIVLVMVTLGIASLRFALRHGRSIMMAALISGAAIGASLTVPGQLGGSGGGAGGGSANRAFAVLSQLAGLVQKVVEGGQIMLPLIFLGGQRIITLVISYGCLFQNYGIGHGIATWSLPGVFQNAGNYIGVNPFDYAQYISELSLYVQTKPQSFGSMAAFDMGVPGLAVFLWVLYAVFRGQEGDAGRGLGSGWFIFFAPALFWLLLFNLSALPMPWLLLAYSLHVRAHPRPPPIPAALPAGLPAPSANGS
jgi:hypothetical protein